MLARPASIVLLVASVAARATQPLAWSPPAVAAGGKGVIALADGRLLIPTTERVDGRTRLRVSESRDFGRTFTTLGVVAERPSPNADLGDACLMQSRDGRIWMSYRDNDAGVPRYAIKVARSDDGGRTWAEPMTVVESNPPKGMRFSRGLWASCLCERRDGSVLCLYDDEETPTRAGFPGHQWITAKTYDGHRGWADATTVARAHDPTRLSRDGMMTVVEPRPGELLCVFESVEMERPHANLIRSVASVDDGKTWSWQAAECDVVYRAAKPNHLAISPWTIKLPDGRLAIAFCTDEDRDQPGVSGTPVHDLSMSVKLILSDDGGRTWSTPQAVSGAKRTYLPGVVARSTGAGVELFVPYLDYDVDGSRGVRAILPAVAK